MGATADNKDGSGCGGGIWTGLWERDEVKKLGGWSEERQRVGDGEDGGG
jgi:hypothetical protein